MKRILLCVGLVVATGVIAKPAAPATGVQQLYGAKPGPGGTYIETGYPGYGPGYGPTGPTGPMAPSARGGAVTGPMGPSVPSPRLNMPVTGPVSAPSARGGTFTMPGQRSAPGIRGSSFGPGYEEEFPAAPGRLVRPAVTRGNETIQEEVTKEIQGIPPHVPGRLTPIIATRGGGEITAPPGGPAISRRMATETTQPTIVQGGAKEIYGARPGRGGTYVEQTFPPAQPTVPPTKPSMPPTSPWVTTGGAAVQRTTVTPPTGPSTTKGKLVVPMGPIKHGPVLKPTQPGAPKLPTEPTITQQPSTTIVKHTVTTTVPTVTVTKGGTTEVTSKPVWVSQNKWERSGGWTGSRKVKRGEKHIRTGGVIVISGSRTLSPIYQAPWIHISTWSPWVTRWNNWWTNWASYVYQPTWVSWSYPSWWSYLPTWYVDLGLTSDLLISLAKQHQYTELYQYFNGAVDQLQGELDRLNYEIQELTVRQFTEAIACLQAQVEEIQQEVDSLNQDIAWVTVKASYESGAQTGY